MARAGTRETNMTGRETMAANSTARKSQGRSRVPYFPKGRQIDEAARQEVAALLGEQPRRRDLLIEHLHLIQDAHGHLSAAHLAALAAELDLSQAEVFEVATFYHHFDVVKEGETAPAPLTVRVCDGIACEMAGAGALLSDLEDAFGDAVRVIHAPCVGACDKAPCAVVKQNQVFNATADSVRAAVSRRRYQKHALGIEPGDLVPLHLAVAAAAARAVVDDLRTHIGRI